MKEYAVQGHEPSLLPVEGYKLTWSDEFDGTELDTTKWEFRSAMTGQKWPSWTDSKESLYLDGESHAVFTLIRDEKDGHLCCAHLQTGANPCDEPLANNRTDQGDGVSKTLDNMYWRFGKLHEHKKLFKYGYFECRCFLQQKPGWWSAFWMQSPTIGTSLDAKTSGSEVDILESFVPGTMNWNNVFCAGYGVDGRRTKLGPDGQVLEGQLCKINRSSTIAPTRTPIDHSQWHRFGLLWEKDKYTFFVDGKKTCETTNDVSAVPEFLLISTEVYGYRKEGHQPIEEAYGSVGDHFIVDYVRVFQKEDEQ